MNRLRALGRVLLLWLIRAFYRRAPRPAPAIDVARIRKVLVVRIDPRVGNVLLTTPLLRALRRGLPNARIDLVLAAGKESLVTGLADRLIPFRKKDFFRAPRSFWAALAALRAEQYDVAIEAGHWHTFSFTSAWLTRATRARVRIGHARGPTERFLTHEVQKDPANVRDVASKLELLRPLGVAPQGEQPETTVDAAPDVAARAQQVTGPLGPAPVVSLNPGARKPSYRWAPEGFAALAKRLRGECGVTPLVVWGPGEEELARAVVTASGGAAVLAPPTDLPTLAGVFRRSAVVVTNDTGPMHLAVATGASVVATLVQDDGVRWSHGGERFEGVPVRGVAGADVDAVFSAVARALLRREGRESKVES